jgi:hypothetical protein
MARVIKRPAAKRDLILHFAAIAEDSTPRKIINAY